MERRKKSLFRAASSTARPLIGGESARNYKENLTGAKHQRQQSAGEQPVRGGLWPSTKNLPTGSTPKNAVIFSTTLQDHLIYEDFDYIDMEQEEQAEEEEEEEEEKEGERWPNRTSYSAASTISSRQRSSSERLQNGTPARGRQNHSSPSKAKKPETPPSLCSSSFSSALSLSGPLPSAERRTDFGIDIPSTESDISYLAARSSSYTSPARISRSLQATKIASMARRSSNSPQTRGTIGTGVGSLLSIGLGNLFRSRKSFSGTRLFTKSPARGPLTAAAAGNMVELQHSLRMAQNHLMQWRFANARMNSLNLRKWATAQTALVSAWHQLLELRVVVMQKRMQFGYHKLSIKFDTLTFPQNEALERWENIEKHHMAALSSTIDSLHGIVCKLPLTDHAKLADSQILSILLRKAMNLMAAINENIAACNFMKTTPLLSELAQTVSMEKPLIKECFELLGSVFKLQLEEESLRCQHIQLKSSVYL